MYRDRLSIRLALQVFFLLLTSHFSGCAIVYSSADVDGRIIDSETQKPIEGAVAVGIWQLEGTTGLEHCYGDAIHLTESITDKNGYYHLAGFDNLWIPPTHGNLRTRDPRIYILAKGYEPISRSRSLFDKQQNNTHRVSPLNGMDITLQKNHLQMSLLRKVGEQSLRQ